MPMRSAGHWLSPEACEIPMSEPILGCIADDFTGATDLANNLVRSGLRSVQTIGVPSSDDPLDADAIVVALKSRTVAPVDAVAQSLAALRWLQRQGAQQVYFKYCSTFDSTPSGNIGPVVDALLDALEGPGLGFTIACPAFPLNGRTVFNGHLFVGEALLSDSSMRHHPLTPMTDANLVRVLQAQTRRRVGLVTHAVVDAGAEAIRRRFAELQSAGVGVAIVDATSEEHLLSIGDALAGMPLVTAGSGLASGLARSRRHAGDRTTPALPPAQGPRAILSGSCSAATNAQVTHWRRQGGAAYAIDPLAVVAGADICGQTLAWAREHLAEGPVLIYSTADPHSVQAVQARLGVHEAGAWVERTLAKVACGLVDAGVRQLVVAGGETSGAVVQALGIARMSIGAQIVPGVPWTSAITNREAGVPVHLALKSGNFGGDDFFARAFAMLEKASE